MRNEVLIITVRVIDTFQVRQGKEELAAALDADYTLLSTTAASWHGEVLVVYTLAREHWNHGLAAAGEI